MNHRIFTIGILLAGTVTLSAQWDYIPSAHVEAGAGMNLSYFDVGGGSPGYSFQGNIQYDLSYHWRAGVTLGYHRTFGTDAGTANQGRGYEYISDLNEISLRGIYVVRFIQFPVRKWKQKLEPRIYAGGGMVMIHPHPGSMMAAASTSGYSRFAPLVKGGIGLGCKLTEFTTLVLEGGTSFSFSDYLEGYSNPEYSHALDLFHTLFLKIDYRIPVGFPSSRRLRP